MKCEETNGRQNLNAPVIGHIQNQYNLKSLYCKNNDKSLNLRPWKSLKISATVNIYHFSPKQRART